MKKHKDKSCAVIKFLNKEGFSPTSKIATGIKDNKNVKKEMLKDLEKQKLIKKTATPNATYW